jgi:GT2 family glycosyltransferase
VRSVDSVVIPRVWCTEFQVDQDAGGTLQAPAEESFDVARVLLRRYGEPIGFVQVALIDGAASMAELLVAMDADVRERMTAQVDAIRDITSTETISVVVCTRNRGPVLRGCLARLRELTTTPLVEFLIVDNAPSDEQGRLAFHDEVGADPRFRYVVEPRPGLSCARNRGLTEATGDIIVYTDDDVRVDAGWVTALANGFARRPDVACVTGLVCTASLTTAAEHYFDGKVSWSARCDRRIYDGTAPDGDVLYPYAPGLFGTGASMAFRTATLRELGGFDEALGAGTRTAGGEDLDIFVRILQGGHAIAYEPAAIAWHCHRSDLDGLRRQMFGYGAGLSAFITKHLLHPGSRRDLVGRIPRGMLRLATISRSSQTTLSSTSFPSRSLLARELGGMLMGPVLYGIARRQAQPRPVPTSV